ncbi:MAG: hypothetical protein M3R24_41685 [Chloroflexota bacterium]|nr:hypothetical protein [Chloroflexota bacterium]
MLKAGFGQTEGYAQCVSSGTREATAQAVQAHLTRLQSADFRDAALHQQWASETDLASMEQELKAWGQRPDAFQAVMWRAAVGFVGSKESQYISQ